ncbi:hypothetical protein FEM03_21450 [Phragmitibacter flavus]|uniref:SecDF P1 head subdomain domain-containing protein n=1 Tax=Phragmitibacter flavus TaxID=2576071 RepID=A0A5R8K8V9_9BACT|nr:hypothetical protein [Phragmitibacter flavus]TLD68748.1 hypothetical protein FEM03_21450 [Phragmitibacter flavus]
MKRLIVPSVLILVGMAFCVAAEELEAVTLRFSQVTEVEGGSSEVLPYADPYVEPEFSSIKVEKVSLIDSSDIKSAYAFADAVMGPTVGLDFTELGAKKFAEVTKRSIGKRLAIIIDGKVISAPNIKDQITGGKAVISGKFSMDDADALARKINAGLPKTQL